MPSFDAQDWTRTLAAVERRLANVRNFESWVRPIELVGVEGAELTLRVPDALFLEYLAEYEYVDVLSESLQEVTGQAWELSFCHNGGTPLGNGKSSAAQVELPLHMPEPAGDTAEPAELPGLKLVSLNGAEDSIEDQAASRGLIPDYGFESFVKGPSNELAYAACRAVAESPGQTYNPMFIYGGAGLGKTHLLQAIGKEMLRHNPKARVKYVTSETYINELVEAIQNDGMQNFRDRYRTECDVLLIDDIQFLAGKDGTQTEFFHTFNALYGANKQIVFSSDRFPEEIPSLEERLRSRFQWGLIADIQPPQIETRLAILRKKAEGRGLDVPDDVAMYIASRVRSNVRRLEGALIKLAAHSTVRGVPVTMAMAKEALRDFLPNDERITTAEDIIKLVAKHFGVKAADMQGERRHKAISFPRQIAMYLCREHTKLSYPEIGTRFGGRDHTTVLSGVRKIQGLLDKEDVETRRAVEVLDRQLTR